MTDDKEFAIRLRFLDEAQEYLNTLESRVMGLAEGFGRETINEALRAAHSIKGGAGLMGLPTLSKLAHRLEDGLKVLKIRRGKITVDIQLEQQLLVAIDCMGQVVHQNRQHIKWGDDSPGPVDWAWLQQHVEPIFAKLHERLGEPAEEDFQAVFAADNSGNIIALLFQSEVAGCLQRLESLMAEHDPCLREEVVILAQELGGLGEMLQIETYTQLCRSIEAQMTIADDHEVVPLSRAALLIWKQAQDSVLRGNLAAIPREFLGRQATLLDARCEEQEIPLPKPQTWKDTSEVLEVQVMMVPEDKEHASNSQAESATDLEVAGSEVAGPEVVNASNGTPNAGTEDLTTPEHTVVDFTRQTVCEPMAAGTEPAIANASDSLPFETTLNNTVRVPTQQIDHLSDLFGSLIVERTCLELELKRLRQTVRNLKGRVQSLDRANEELQDTYDFIDFQEELAQSHNTHLVDEQRLGLSCNFLGLNCSRKLHAPFRKMKDTVGQLQEVGNDIDLALNATEQATRCLRKTSRQVQKSLTQLRMCPLADIFDRFPQALRQMSLQYNKPVELHLEGENILVDRTVLEVLQESLMHIVRNCFDHGIEDLETRRLRGKPNHGTISLLAEQQGSRTIITIRDDGGGIPLAKIRDRACQMEMDEALLAAASTQDLLSLIFEPGFSTASQVTELSGRGIGMDIVRNRLKEIRGEIQVNTKTGVGTVFTLSIPFAPSVTRVLIAESNGVRMAFPIDAIEEMIVLPSEHLERGNSSASFTWNGEQSHLVKLSDWLHCNFPVLQKSPDIAPVTTPIVLLVRHGQHLVGIQMDRSWGEQEVTLRQVVGNLPMPIGFNGCTIGGDGQAVPLVNLPDLLDWIASGKAADTSAAVTSAAATPKALYRRELTANPETSGARKPHILLIDDSLNVRQLMTRTLREAGYQVVQAKDGQDALDKLVAGLTVEGVICDEEMPRLDGYGFLAKLKAMAGYNHLPVALLTARDRPEHQIMAMNLGAAACFTKPYDKQTLLQTLEALV